MAEARLPFHLMAKPIGPVCNLGCEYCFYLATNKLYPEKQSYRMSDNVLEQYIRQYIAAIPGPRVDFTWQGGEPTLLGIDFFRKAVTVQKQYLPAGWACTNALQTNGTLLDEEWGSFLKEENFLVGISIDGPGQFHDAFRRDKQQGPTFKRAMRGLRLLKEHGVDFNVLCVVNGENVKNPGEVYHFFKANGVEWLQFIPLVERDQHNKASQRSVGPSEYATFLTAIFDEWVRRDVGKIFVQVFEEAIQVWAGFTATTCVYGKTCGRSLILEHNGDVYACDHFVGERYKRGNIMTSPLSNMVDSLEQARFGRSKYSRLPAYCLQCNVRFICNGGCPKDRWLNAPDGEPGLNYLCTGYRRFFRYIAPYMLRMAELLRE